MNCNNGFRIMLVFLFLLPLAGDAKGADAGAPRSGELYQLSPPGTLPKIPAPPPYKPMPAQPTPAPNPVLPEHRGALNPKTGEFYPRSGSGYFNPRTGEYFPGKEPDGSK
jgi:hypothetical protein